jgi:predicted acetyltransferase
MSRVIDAEGAVAARGFAEGLDVELPFTLRDEVVGANDGHFVLSVQKGRGVLAKAQAADGPRLHVRGFSSLYTGLARCAVLARSGLLQGGTPAQHAALDLAFAGGRPWMLDEF